ncbi:hypothetical protein [Methylobacterium sp.]|uniref:hypothetical protein n=1 Tax=Methylobacterium sp. TaxID=409 RepID=UPI003B004C50
MIWFVTLVVLLILMSISEKLWGNPLSFIGAGFLAFCVTLLIGVVQTALGLH